MAMVKLGDKLGNILVKSGLITQEQLGKALALQQGTTKRIGELLIELGLVTELDITIALSKQLGIPYVTASSGLLAPPKDEGLENSSPRNLPASTSSCLSQGMRTR
ncbi:MAG: hypothetical protein A2105_04755 [Omnitrophica WOR_2 bacterium GWF2_63_9]|nr:MAG: hypothetical protein A2105_04755 [Omnitrophica WOR_2 bacterium GWF2_63_9]